MIKTVIVCVLVFSACYITYVSCYNDNLLAKGKWSVINVQKCNDDASYDNKIVIVKKKYNRTIDVFNFELNLVHEINSAHGVYMKACKMVDGGCKPYQEMSDNSLENFVKKYAKDNFYRFCEVINGGFTDFPLPAGEFSGSGYVFDYNELPEDGPIGEYIVEAYVMQGNQKVACVELHVIFVDIDEWESGLDDDSE